MVKDEKKTNLPEIEMFKKRIFIIHKIISRGLNIKIIKRLVIFIELCVWQSCERRPLVI